MVVSSFALAGAKRFQAEESDSFAANRPTVTEAWDVAAASFTAAVASNSRSPAAQPSRPLASVTVASRTALAGWFFHVVFAETAPTLHSSTGRPVQDAAPVLVIRKVALETVAPLSALVSRRRYARDRPSAPSSLPTRRSSAVFQ